MCYSIPYNTWWKIAHCAILLSLFVPRKTWLSSLFLFQWVLRIMSSSTPVVIVVAVVSFPLPFFFYNAYFPVVDSHLIVLRQVQPNPTHLFFPWRAPHHSANSSLVWFFPLSKCITVSPNSQLPITLNFLIIFTTCHTHQQAGIATSGTWY